MKPTHCLFRFLAACASTLCLASCVTTETTTTAPDGTVTHIRVVAPAPGSTETASAIAGAIAAEVISEK